MACKPIAIAQQSISNYYAQLFGMPNISPVIQISAILKSKNQKWINKFELFDSIRGQNTSNPIMYTAKYGYSNSFTSNRNLFIYYYLLSSTAHLISVICDFSLLLIMALFKLVFNFIEWVRCEKRVFFFFLCKELKCCDEALFGFDAVSQLLSFRLSDIDDGQRQTTQ